MIRTSESTALIFAALAKAQADMPSALKDTKGQVGNQVRNYADLASVREAARGPLSANDLVFVQFPSSAPTGYVRVITRLAHESGEWIEDDEGVLMPTGQSTAQAVGSALTYARRYSLMAALGIVADDDDDGHAASVAPRAPRAPRAGTAREIASPANADNTLAAGPVDRQVQRIAILTKELGVVERTARLALLSEIVGRPVGSSNDLSGDEKSNVIVTLEKMEKPS